MSTKLYGKHTHEVAERILDAFRNPEQLPKALSPIFIQRNNDSPCRQWSWHNQLLVALSGTSDARGIRQWNQINRKLKKGCNAIWILAPCIKKIKQENGNSTEEERSILYGFRSIPVFALEDTEGEALPQEPYDDWVKQLPLLDVAKAWDIQVGTYSYTGGAPLGFYRHSSNGNKAILLGTENITTWLHELVHASDHRLTNLKGQTWCKEIVAELGAAILSECLGQESEIDLGGAFHYIERYAKEAKMDTVRACIQVLDRTCNCVRHILDTAEAYPQEKSLTINS